MRRVLVTGATGGLGLGLVAALRADGFNVRATGRSLAHAARLQVTGAEFIAADLNEAQAVDRLCDGMDSVIHAAALSSPWGRDADFRRANVAITKGLMESARRAGCRRFVFVSSPSVYADTCDRLNLTEDSPLPRRFLNAYAATKAEAERLVLAANDETMATIAIRPRAIVGPDDQVLLPRFLRVIRKGVFPLLHKGQALIELSDVRDVARALILAEVRAPDLGGQVFNISGGHALPVKETVAALAKALGQDLRFVGLPFAPMRAVAATMEAVAAALPGRPEPPLTVYSLCTLAFSQTFDLTRARTRLGYAPRHDALETALSVAQTLANRGVA